MPVIEIKSQEQFEELIKSKVTIVDFTATWCGPCQMIKPIFHEFSENFSKLQFLKVDVDEQSEIAEKAGISAMPTFQVYVNGQKVDELVGASKEALKNIIEKYAK